MHTMLHFAENLRCELNIMLYSLVFSTQSINLEMRDKEGWGSD